MKEEKSNFPAQVTKLITVRAQGNPEVETVEEVVVTAGLMLRELAEQMMAVIEQNSWVTPKVTLVGIPPHLAHLKWVKNPNKPGFVNVTVDGVEEELDTTVPIKYDLNATHILWLMNEVVIARCVQTHPKLKNSISPGVFEYPSILGPVLAAIGRLDLTESNLVLQPIPPRDRYRKILDANFRNEVPENYTNILAALKMAKVHIAMGLPKDRVTTNTSFFDIATVGNSIFGRNSELSPGHILVSTLVNLAPLVGLFGQYRVLYGAVNQVKSAIAELAVVAVKSRDIT